MDKIKFNETSGTYPELVGISPERTAQLKVLMGRALNNIQFDEQGKRNRIVDSKKIFIRLVELGETPAEVSFLAYIAGRKIAEHERDSLNIPASIYKDMPDSLKRMVEAVLED